MAGRLANAVGSLERRLLADANSPAVGHIGSWDDAVSSLGLDDWLRENSNGKALLSRLLTYPLTIAHYWKQYDGLQEMARSRKLRVSVLGARAESELPSLYWQQLSRFTNAEWQVRFVGPQLSRLPPQHRVLGDKDKLGVSFSSMKGMFHDVVGDDELKGTLDSDLYVFFNSGVGNSGEGLHWQKTMDIMSSSGDPNMLFTSFNSKDLKNDLAALKTQGFAPKCVEENNPFGSSWKEQFRGEELFVNKSSILV
mmetsp:Transcript_3120/g.4486  ORF Transcript_3120/g.4486 Transcript_3120/m.4486 type:complete len:253 (-) Transcript_3120:631-1389(-)|eukprot:CAMPEP_0203750656 /NCGR_PEP_ID=MMETSP0098-20131031/4864_1 /ASSEMBLY_ACC=CAM_ASM_000208 /TAXON_ID=96639 /ORGANISM=" , Strain NY0313808BC1" /LENGTH=252 /DNA_ID=CAMNT_0050640057 /DNA_START=238 /DNA_END=996 /DNA_ORIENTATION=-